MGGIRPQRTRQLSCALAWLLAVTGADGPAVSTASQTPVHPVTLTLHSPRNPKQTLGTIVTLEEVKREQGRRGTRVTYRIATSGFSPAKTLRMQFSSLSIGKSVVILTGIQADESGSLARGKFKDGTSAQLANFDFTLEDYNKGEARPNLDRKYDR
jgi:hypothetical protein